MMVYVQELAVTILIYFWAEPNLQRPKTVAAMPGTIFRLFNLAVWAKMLQV